MSLQSFLVMAFLLLVALALVLGEYLQHRRNTHHRRINKWGWSQVHSNRRMRAIGHEPSLMDFRVIPSRKEWQPFSNVVHL